MNIRHPVIALVICGSLLAAADRSEASPIAPCAVEDASSGPVPCVWLATEFGNQEGRSFRVYSNHHFKYISHKAARRLLGFDQETSAH